MREPFNRDKIYAGLAKACWKRPVSDEQILDVVARTGTGDLRSGRERDRQPHDRRDADGAAQQLDQVAYVRFASVYREFQDVRDFVDELQPMLELGSEAQDLRFRRAANWGPRAPRSFPSE